MTFVGVWGASIRRPDSFTKLHLRMNGEGNTFRDLTRKTVTAYGNATQNSNKPHFLGNVAQLDGNGSYVAISEHIDFNFMHTGSTPYIISFYCHPTRFANGDGIFDTAMGTTINAGIYLGLKDTGSLSFQIFRGVNNSFVLNSISTGVMTLNAWNFVEIEVDLSLTSNAVAFYINNVNAGYGTNTGNAVSTANCVHAWIGGEDSSYPTYMYQGYLSELLISSTKQPHLSTRRT